MPVKTAPGMKFIFPNKAAGAIIGSGGSNITRVQEETGAKVVISTSDKEIPSQERICLVTGEKEPVLKAIREIIDIVYAEPKRDISILEMALNNNACGLLIGRGGETIKFLKEESGCQSVAIATHALYGYGDRRMTIKGTVDQIKHIAELIWDNIEGDDRAWPEPFIRKSGQFPIPTNLLGQQGGVRTSIQVAVPDSLIGSIIGKSGETIRMIQQCSQTRITISNRGEFLPDSTNRRVDIEGTALNIQLAQMLITNKVSEASSRQSGIKSDDDEEKTTTDAISELEI